MNKCNKALLCLFIICLQSSSDAKVYYSGSSVASKEDSTYNNSTNRLIVKSTEVLDERDSVDYVYGYNDLHILSLFQ